MERLQSLFGFVVILGFLWLISENRRRVNWRTVGGGVGLQVGLCLLFLRLPVLKRALQELNSLVEVLSDATKAGTAFVFAYLGGAPPPFDVPYPAAACAFAFRWLPLVLVISSLVSLLFYWRVIPVIVRGLSWLLRKSLGVGGCEALGGAANIFIGMVEAPVCVRPYLQRFSRSEMFAIMTTGMATIAGTVLILYASMLSNTIEGALGHLLVASLISAPAAFVVAKMMIPQEDEPVTGEMTIEEEASGAIDALTRGASYGVHLLIQIVAMLIVAVALVELVNIALRILPDVAGGPLTLQRVFGWALAPLAWLIGLPWSEAAEGGALLGVKTALNELLAYDRLAKLPPDALSPRSRIIMTYALCGFANFGSLGIMLGGLGAMVPERRTMIARLGMRSILAGTLATCMTGAVVGVVW